MATYFVDVWQDNPYFTGVPYFNRHLFESSLDLTWGVARDWMRQFAEFHKAVTDNNTRMRAGGIGIYQPQVNGFPNEYQYAMAFFPSIIEGAVEFGENITNEYALLIGKQKNQGRHGRMALFAALPVEDITLDSEGHAHLLNWQDHEYRVIGWWNYLILESLGVTPVMDSKWYNSSPPFGIYQVNYYLKGITKLSSRFRRREAGIREPEYLILEGLDTMDIVGQTEHDLDYWYGLETDLAPVSLKGQLQETVSACAAYFRKVLDQCGGANGEDSGKRAPTWRRPPEINVIYESACSFMRNLSAWKVSMETMLPYYNESFGTYYFAHDVVGDMLNLTRELQVRYWTVLTYDWASPLEPLTPLTECSYTEG